MGPWRGRILAWAPALLWAGWIHHLLASPVAGTSPAPFWSFAANLGHAFLFGVLALLLLPGCRLLPLGTRGRFVAAGAVSLALAAAEEVVQAGIPSRSASLPDLLTGLMGILLALHGLWSLLVRGGLSGWEALTLIGACLTAALDTFPIQ